MSQPQSNQAQTSQAQSSPNRLQKIIFVLFNFLFILTPFAFSAVNEELFEFNKMLLVYGFSVLIGFFWMLRTIRQKKIIFSRTKLDLPLLLFLLSQILATVFSIHPRTSIFGYYTRFHGGLLSTLAYIFLYYALVSNLSKKQITSLLKSSLLTAAGVSLYAILEHFGHSPSCLLITGQFDVNCWRQDVQQRVFATLGQPNWLAGYLIGLLPLSLIWALKKYRFLFISILLFSALIFTQSRSGLLGLSLGFLIVLLGFLGEARRILDPSTYLWRKRLLIVICSLVGLALVFGTAFTPSLLQLGQKITHQTQPTQASPSETDLASPLYRGTGSGKIRQIVWWGAIKIWQSYPLFGSGVETFAYSYYQDRPLAHNLVSEWDFLYNKAHNEWLNYLATTGLFGLGSYLLLLGAAGWSGWQAAKTAQGSLLQSVNLALLAGLGAISASNFLGFSTVTVTLIMFLLLAALVSLNDLVKPISSPDSKIKFSGKDLVLIAPLALISLHLLLNVWQIWSTDYIFTQGKRLIEQGEYTQGVSQLEKAVSLRPRLGLLHDELAETYAKIAAQLAQLDQAEAAQDFATLAIKESDLAIRLNPVHLNFYQTRYRVFSHLSLIDPAYLTEANDALEAAKQLAPTHPKLPFHQASIKLAQKDQQTAIKLLKQAVSMRPNYIKARYKLAQTYHETGQLELAKQQYQAILELIPSDTNVQQLLSDLEKEISNEN
ncbi:MAG: tetratricopeptide repeat protein [Candidatus Pacebacteria bacterium]|nr:tetratricopeptide repeat protein [Candidatus Paceibacterota bacterium]